MRNTKEVNLTGQRLKMPKHPDREDGERVNDPNILFARMFPEAVNSFGPGFLVSTYDDMHGLPRTVPVELNEDAWACALGGDRRLGHRVVFYPPEGTFYFYDPLLDAFCATTEAKLRALMSNYLIRCSQDCGSLVDIRPLVTDFRKPVVLEKVILRAKALLAADKAFFEGAQGQRRIVAGKVVDPNETPAYVEFVKRGIVREPEGKLTIADAFSRYYSFCKSQGQVPLTRQEFKHLVAEVIREEFRIGIRHDVMDERGKAQHGWLGIDCRFDVPEALGVN